VGLIVTDAVLDGERVSLRCDGGVITSITPASGTPVAAAARHAEAPTVADGADEVVDAGGMAVLPGFVNGHGHAAMTLLRGLGSDLQLQEWLEDVIWPAEARLTEEDVYWGVRLAAVEMLRSGTTHFFDMYWHPTATARAAEDAGLRATVGAPLFDGRNPSRLSALTDAALASLDALEPFGPLITPSLTPHAIYTVSEESLAFVAETAAERDLIVHTHLSETRREVDDWLADHDVRPAFHLANLGLLGPRTILAHGNHLDDDELDLIAERGATIVTNPVSNMKLAGSRIFPYSTATARGIPVGLGTDGASSNNSLDMLSDLKVFALIQKHDNADPGALRAADALAVAQGRRSALLGGEPLRVGGRADFVLVDTSSPAMTPGPLVDNLVYSATSEVVDTVVIDGHVRMRHRQVDDLEEILGHVRERAARLTA
jgi:5-methylthioadenosine/S-adenosylhomocysteine deaminase